VWFRLNIGRLKNADPRWLIPLICRQGKITKQDIGQIRILERETKFEIAAPVAERFIAAIRQIERPEGRIEPLDDPQQAEAGFHPQRTTPSDHNKGRSVPSSSPGKGPGKSWVPGKPKGRRDPST
jgi:ATP-dependent RNA helicase DeaD